MNNPKHKGTEFSNISRVWEENEKAAPRATEIHDRGNEFSNVSEVWDENEKKAAREGNEESSTGEAPTP